MIINIISRSDPRAALHYGARIGHWATPDGPAQELPGSLPPGTPLAEYTKEYKRLAALRPELKKKIVHIIIAFAEEDRKLGPNHLARIGQETLEKLGYGDCLVRWTEHMDGKTQHMHAVVSAITHAGERVDRTGDRWRGQQISREMELENGLWRVSSIKGQPVLEPLPIPGQEIATAVPSPPGWAEEVDARVRQIMRPGATLPQLRDELAALGVALEFRWTKDGSKIQGLGFRFADKFEIASRVSKDLSLSGLQKQGLDYLPARDIPLLAKLVLGPPAALALAKVPTLPTAAIPRIAAAKIAPATLPPSLRIPEVSNVRRPKVPTLIASAYLFACQLAARLWHAAAPAPLSQHRRPALPSR